MFGAKPAGDAPSSALASKPAAELIEPNLLRRRGAFKWHEMKLADAFESRVSQFVQGVQIVQSSGLDGNVFGQFAAAQVAQAKSIVPFDINLHVERRAV